MISRDEIEGATLDDYIKLREETAELYEYMNGKVTKVTQSRCRC